MIYIPVMSMVGLFRFDLFEFILNLSGYVTSYCIIAWYVRFYLELIIIFPAVVLLERKLHIVTKNCSISFILLLLGNWIFRMLFLQLEFTGVSYVTEFFNYLPVVMVGYYVAKVSLFERSADKLHKYLISKAGWCGLYLAIFFCMFIARGLLTGNGWFNIDVLLAPIFVFCMWLLIRLLDGYKMTIIIKQLLLFLGKYSLELWFLHAIFFIGNINVQRIAYWPKVDILILVWTIIFLVPFAIAISKLKDFICCNIFKLKTN